MFLSGKWINAHQIDNRRWALNERVVWKGNEDTISVPRGFITDFATIPKFLHGFIGPTGKYWRASVIHDWLLKTLRMKPTFQRQASPRDIDGIFRKICREEGIPVVLCWLLWVGVRLGALGSRERRPGWWRDAPLVTIWAVLALPVVAPIALGVGLGMIPYWLYRWLAYALGR